MTAIGALQNSSGQGLPSVDWGVKSESIISPVRETRFVRGRDCKSRTLALSREMVPEVPGIPCAAWFFCFVLLSRIEGQSECD